MRSRKFFTLFNMLVVVMLMQLCLSIAPVAAQSEQTPDPADGAITVITQPLPQIEVFQLTWTAIAGIVAAALGTGLIGGFGGALLIIRSLQQNDALKYSIERLFLSASPDTQRLIRGSVTVIREGAELADALTDGIIEMQPDRPSPAG